MNQNIIVTEPSSNIRKAAREAMKGRMGLVIAGTALYLALMIIPMAIILGLFGGDANSIDSVSVDPFAYEYFYGGDAFSSNLLSVYALIITGPLTLGYTHFAISIFRRRETSSSVVLSGFSHFPKALGLYLLMSLFIFLWTLLFIIPGIIASYRYSMAFYLLADNPQMGVNEAITKSKEMMVGNKFKFFCLELSFIGWIMLFSIAYAIIVTPISIGFGSAPSLIFYVVVLIFIIPIYSWIIGYMQTAFAGFYEILIGARRQYTMEAGFTVENGFTPNNGGQQQGGAESYQGDTQNQQPQNQQPQNQQPTNGGSQSEQTQSQSEQTQPQSEQTPRYNPFEDKQEK